MISSGKGLKIKREHSSGVEGAEGRGKDSILTLTSISIDQIGRTLVSCVTFHHTHHNRNCNRMNTYIALVRRRAVRSHLAHISTSAAQRLPSSTSRHTPTRLASPSRRNTIPTPTCGSSKVDPTTAVRA